MPLARSGPKANFFPFGSAKAISPACLAGREPFVQFLQSTLQCSTWNFFLRSRLFSFGHAFGLLRAKGFFFSSGSTKAISPALLTGRVPFVSFPPAIMSMFHVELFSVMPLARSGSKVFFLRLCQRNLPGLSGREGGLVSDYIPKPIQMFHMEHFSLFKMPKSRVLCALLVSIPLQVCYNNRRSPFSG